MWEVVPLVVVVLGSAYDSLSDVAGEKWNWTGEAGEECEGVVDWEVCEVDDWENEAGDCDREDIGEREYGEGWSDLRKWTLMGERKWFGRGSGWVKSKSANTALSSNRPTIK